MDCLRDDQTLQTAKINLLMLCIIIRLEGHQENRVKAKGIEKERMNPRESARQIKLI